MSEFKSMLLLKEVF